MKIPNDILIKPKTMDANEMVAAAIPLLKNSKNDEALVITVEGKYLGIIDGRCLRNFSSDASKTKLEGVAVKPPTLSQDSELEDAIEKLLNERVNSLPVLKNGKAVGMFTRLNALKILMTLDSLNDKKVSSFCTMPAKIIPETNSIADAKREMKTLNLYRLVAVDKNGEISGIITAHDFAVNAAKGLKQEKRNSTFRPTQRETVTEESIKSIMTSDVKIISKNDSLKKAIEEMLKRQISSLVVSENGIAIGMLTARDCFKALLVEKKIPVSITGLKEDEKQLQPSIMEEAGRFFEKASKTVGRKNPEDSLAIKVKSAVEGNRKRFEIKATLTLKEGIHTASNEKEPKQNKRIWDLHLSLKDILEKLEKQLNSEKKPKHRDSREDIAQERLEEAKME